MAAHGKMKGCLKGVPVGGPYTIELKAGGEALVIKDVLVGDIWLLGGQSNMQGYGLFPKTPLAANPLVRAFYMDDRWATAKDPLHNLWDCVDPVHTDIGGAKKRVDKLGVGPGPAFGNEMHRLTGIPQGLIACAHGGTSMRQWDPKRKNEGGKSLYGAMIRRLNKNGGQAAGLIWYQGCSDATPDDAKCYTARMKELAAAVRRDSKDREFPLAIVQIARMIGEGMGIVPYWNSIQDHQYKLPQVIKNLTTVPAIDLPLDDRIHISGAGQYQLGSRMARAMHVLRTGKKAGLPPIILKTIKIETERELGVAIVEFSNVEGALRSGDRPEGFAIVTSNVRENVLDIQLEGCCARIRSALSPGDLAQAVIHYGYGTASYCNITDGAGRPLPVCGPVHIGKPRAITPFVTSMRVSAFYPSADRLHALECPASLDALQMANRTFGGNFCSLHEDIMRRGGADAVVYYACRFRCSTEMPLALILGYDGPVKAWVDGRLLLHDPDGVNPATTNKRIQQFMASAGEHEVIVALGTNCGAAWGIFLRLERLGLSKKHLMVGLNDGELPEILG